MARGTQLHLQKSVYKEHVKKNIKGFWVRGLPSAVLLTLAALWAVVLLRKRWIISKYSVRKCQNEESLLETTPQPTRGMWQPCLLKWFLQQSVGIHQGPRSTSKTEVREIMRLLWCVFQVSERKECTHLGFGWAVLMGFWQSRFLCQELSGWALCPWLLCSCISKAADAAAEQIKALYGCGTRDRISSPGFFFSLSGDLLERVSPQASLSSEI